MSFIQYRTKSQMRWQDVAFDCYGDPFKVGLLVEANPQIPCTAILPDGLLLNVPILEEIPQDVALLPPWKRP